MCNFVRVPPHYGFFLQPSGEKSTFGIVTRWQHMKWKLRIFSNLYTFLWLITGSLEHWRFMWSMPAGYICYKLTGKCVPEIKHKILFDHSGATTYPTGQLVVSLQLKMDQPPNVYVERKYLQSWSVLWLLVKINVYKFLFFLHYLQNSLIPFYLENGYCFKTKVEKINK